MLIKTITYVDYDGEERTEEFRFNLNKAELAEMELSINGGMEKMLKKMFSERDGARIVAFFKDLVLRSYGVKSHDGKRFIKNQDLRDEFEQTEAYSDFFIELATDADKAAAFVKGILPAKILQEASLTALTPLSN